MRGSSGPRAHTNRLMTILLEGLQQSQVVFLLLGCSSIGKDVVEFVEIANAWHCGADSGLRKYIGETL